MRAQLHYGPKLRAFSSALRHQSISVSPARGAVLRNGLALGWRQGCELQPSNNCFTMGLSLAQAHILSVGKTFCAIVFNFFLRKSLYKQFQPNWYQLKASFWHFVLNYKCTLSCVCYPCWYVTGKMRNDREDAFLNGSGRFQCSLLWASWQENPPPAGEE